MNYGVIVVFFIALSENPTIVSATNVTDHHGENTRVYLPKSFLINWLVKDRGHDCRSTCYNTVAFAGG